MGRSASSCDKRNKHQESQAAPEPTALDEVHIEDVTLLCEVGGCEILWLEGLFEDVVSAEIVGWAKCG